MQDRPTVPELLQAIRGFLERDLIPALDNPRLRYHTLIALNVLRIVERDVAGEEGRLRAEALALAELLGHPPPARPTEGARLRQEVLDRNRELCARIRSGEADAGPWRARVAAHVRAAVEEKLSINNPGQLERGAGERGAG